MIKKLLLVLALLASTVLIAAPVSAAPGDPGTPADPAGRQDAPGQQTAPGLQIAPGQQTAPQAPPAAPPGRPANPGQGSAPGQQSAPGLSTAPGQQRAPGLVTAPGQQGAQAAAPVVLAESPDQVEICHAAGSSYGAEEVSSSSILNGQGHAGHRGDVIPPFDGFAGLNWDAAGQALYAAGCDPAAVGPNPDPNANVKVTMCHANEGTNDYSLITVSISSVVKGTGHGGHGDDIIPPFTYDGGSYAGQNWTSGRAPLTSRADCLAAAAARTATGDTASAALSLASAEGSASASDASSSDGSGWLPTTGGPVFWALLVGAGAVLAGLVTLRLRRSRIATT